MCLPYVDLRILVPLPETHIFFFIWPEPKVLVPKILDIDGMIFFQHSTNAWLPPLLQALLIFLQHSTNAWLPPLLQALMRHIYQRALLEPKADILEILVKLWCKLLEKSPLDLLVGAATPWLGVWFSLSMQPSKVPFDGAYFIEAKHRGRVRTVNRSGDKIPLVRS